MNKKNDTPIANTTYTLAVTHLFQFAFLFILFERFIAHKALVVNIKKPYVYIFMIIYLPTFYFLVYNKTRWARYVEEYKDESDKQRKLGNILVISYLVVSILIYFAVLPFLGQLE
jgi:amino acid transporter